jgi:HSP20 family molecular chaperone IbpA
MNVSPGETEKRKKARIVTVERALLAAILVVQVCLYVQNRRQYALLREEPASQPALNQQSGEAGDGHASIGSDEPTSGPVLPVWASSPADSFRNAERMFREMDRMFESVFAVPARPRAFLSFDEGWEHLMDSPSMDMRESDEGYEVLFCLPGTRASDVRVTLSGRILYVLADLRDPANPDTVLGTYERRVQLPGPIAPDSSPTAALTNGLLRISIPRS